MSVANQLLSTEQYFFLDSLAYAKKLEVCKGASVSTVGKKFAFGGINLSKLELKAISDLDLLTVINTRTSSPNVSAVTASVMRRIKNLFNRKGDRRV